MTTAASKEVAEGRVISQDPQAGDLVDPDAARRLRGLERQARGGRCPTWSARTRTTPPPSCAATGLRVVLTERDADEPKDQVIEMQPPAGTEVSDGSKVTLFWSDGPEEVPNVVGKTEAEATDLIEDAGFKVSRVTDSAGPRRRRAPSLQQSPSAGQTLDKGSTVTIVVSTFVEPTAPPPPPTPTTSASPSP